MPPSVDAAPVLVKFCGLTRTEDAREALRLSAAYVGAIFAESPRQVDDDTARALFAAAGNEVRHVAVFGGGVIEQIADRATQVGADIIQLHGDAGPATIEALHARFPGEVWAVVSVDQGSNVLPPDIDDIALVADGVLFDSRVAGRTGGSGVPLDWGRLGEDVGHLRGRTKIILAGGLNPGNVADAVRALAPDVVDVSSGVESSPGIKDHGLMLAFAEMVRSASIENGATENGTTRFPHEI
jgi:phosphoribosylanthranilate isomerase